MRNLPLVSWSFDGERSCISLTVADRVDVNEEALKKYPPNNDALTVYYVTYYHVTTSLCYYVIYSFDTIEVSIEKVWKLPLVCGIFNRKCSQISSTGQGMWSAMQSEVKPHTTAGGGPRL
jgi:hypothetical protein